MRGRASQRGSTAAASAPRDNLLGSLSEDAFHEYLVNIGRTSRHGAGELLKELSRKQLLDVCNAILQQTISAIEHISNPPEPQSEEEQQQLEMLIEDALQVLRGAALFAHDVLQECHAQPPEALQQSASLLHDNCILAVGDIPELQDAVVKLCCSWWELQAPGRDALVAQALPYILVRANASARAMDVKVCFTMREAYSLLDFDDPTIADVKRLMLRAAFNPAFLHRPEGRRFLAHLFNLHLPMVREMTAIVKNQIPSGRKSVLDAYGEIIFRAWRDATGAFQYEIETACIQELMSCAITAAAPPLAAALRTVLAGLHAQKKAPDVDAMLLRLYEPILFRAFSAANGSVRRNALQLMLDAFPLRDPGQSSEEQDEVMTRQFRHLAACLADDCPLVRIAAVEGCSNILNLYWEIIPQATIAQLVHKLTGDLAFDMSWPAVRVAVLEGLALLVDNPHAQPVLKRALPQLSALLTDPALKVREAMAALLVAVSTTRALHFYEVVPVELLLETMAHDVAPVSHKIQSILVPSYFPNPEEGSARVAMLLKANPAAGQAFCQHLVSSFNPVAEDAEEAGQGIRVAVPIEHVLRLAGDLSGHMLATCTSLVDQQQVAQQQPSRKKQKANARGARQSKAPATGKRRKAASSAAGESAGDAADASEAGQEPGQQQEAEQEQVVEEEHETPETWASIAAGLARVCHGLAGAVAQGQCTEEHVEDVLGEDGLLLLLEGCPNDAARVSILHAAASLPFLTSAAAVRSKLFSDLASGALPAAALSGNAPAAAAAEQAVLGAVVDCLCSAPSGAKLVAMILSSLGLRPSSTIHVPVGKPPAAAAAAAQDAGKGGKGKKGKGGKKAAAAAEEEEEEDVMAGTKCHACGCSEPEDTLLLCDGCESAYHTHCMRPALEAIPQGDWFCHECERQLQLCTMSGAASLRLLAAVMARQSGRQLVRSHGQFNALLTALRGQAHQQGQLLLRQLTSAAAAAAAVAPATAAAPAQQQRGAKGKARGKGRGKNAAAAADDVAAGDGAAQQAAGADGAGAATESATTAAAVSAVGVFCRSALHLALMAVLEPEEEEEEEDAEDSDSEGDQQQRGPKAGSGSSEAALATMVEALNEAIEMCEQVMDACVDSAASAPVLCSALVFAADVLGVLCDAQHLAVLDLTQGGRTTHVARMCDLGHKVLTSCSKAVAASGDAAIAGGKPLPAIRDAYAHVLVLTKQLAASLPQQASATAELAEGEEPSLQQQLQQHMDAEAARLDSEAAASAHLLESLSAALLQQALLRSAPVAGSDADAAPSGTASSGALLAAVRPQLVGLISTLIDRSSSVGRGWVGSVVELVGKALAGSESLQQLLLPDAAADAEDVAEDEQPQGEGQQQAQRGGRQRGKSRQGAASNAKTAGKRRGRSSSAGAEAAEEPDEEQAAQGDGEEAADGEQGGEEAVQPAADEDGDAENMDPNAQPKAGPGASGKADGKGPNSALVQVNPALASLSTMVLNTAKAKNQQASMLDHLASLAAAAWRSSSGSSDRSEGGLGALYLMGLLGFKGLGCNRLRLTGCEANALIKLEMLREDMEATVRATEPQSDGEEGDIAAQHERQQRTEQAACMLGMLERILA